MCVSSKFVGHGWAIEVSVLAVGVWVLYIYIYNVKVFRVFIIFSIIIYNTSLKK